MNIFLNRTFIKGEYAHGHLTIDGLCVCDTLENSRSCVPKGDYVIRLVRCKQYARKMPCLNPHCGPGPHAGLDPASLCDLCPKLPFVCNNSTLPCWCPMLKPGNAVHNRLDGSILVGQYHCLNCLIHPKSVFDALYERIRKSISRGNQVILCVQ